MSRSAFLLWLEFFRKYSENGLVVAPASLLRRRNSLNLKDAEEEEVCAEFPVLVGEEDGRRRLGLGGAAAPADTLIDRGSCSAPPSQY